MTAMTADGNDGLRLTEAQQKRRRARAVATAVALGVLVVLFFLLTIVRLGQNVMTPPV
jgi:hypothetical protein